MGQQRRHLDRAQTELHGQGQLGDLATHPDAFRDAFPKDKPKDVLSIKPLQLENWQTKVKTDYWGLLMNPPKGLEGLAAEPAFSDRHERSLSCRKVRLIAR